MIINFKITYAEGQLRIKLSANSKYLFISQLTGLNFLSSLAMIKISMNRFD